MNKKIYALLLSMILLLTSAAPVSAASTHLSKSKITIGVSQNYTLKLSNNKKKLRWSSSKRSVATVNSKGKVTGKKKGTAVITATVGKSKYKCTITVKKPVMSKSKLSLNTGMSCTLKILYNNKKVKWSSNKKSVATVSSKGKVTAKKTGTATITASIGKTKYKCNVTVNSHTHKWVDVTKTINHPAVTHQEDIFETKAICVKDAWTEYKTVPAGAECVQCGYRTKDPNDMGYHCFENAHSSHNIEETQTIYHDAVYEDKKVKTGTKTIIDKAAWTEKKVTGQKCSICGKTK